MTSRRRFMHVVPVAALWFAAGEASSQAPMLDEKDPQAVALGYVADAKRVDKAKYPKFDASQQCANCALYQGQANAADAPCTLFGGKRVAGAGWCSAWAKKG